MKLISLGSILAATAVVFGAFAAHALKSVLDSYQLAIFETGTRYQMYHSLAIVLVGLLQHLRVVPSQHLQRIGYLFALGILFFSGSLYLLACRHILAIDSWASVIGPITPIGGVFFIVAWGWLAYQSLSRHE